MRTSNVVRSVAWLTLVVTLMFFFLDSLGTMTIESLPTDATYGPNEEPNLLLGMILIGTGLMILIETTFTRNFPEISDPRSINFALGAPSGILALTMGISWILGLQWVINTFGVTLDGVYLAGLIILLYEGTMTQIGVDM